MATPLYSNFLLSLRGTSLLTYLNTVGKTLRLFKNNFSPTPATPVASFTECNFVGYVPVPLAGKFSGPTFVQNGQYELTSVVMEFDCSGGAPQDIWGWFITDGASLVACQVFPAPITIGSGGAYTFALRPQEISQSIL